ALRAAAARPRTAPHGRPLAQLPERPRHAVRDHLPDARGLPGPSGPGARSQGLLRRLRLPAELPHRLQPRLSRRALPERRPRGLVRRPRLGAPLLDDRAPPAAPWNGGAAEVAPCGEVFKRRARITTRAARG